MKTESKHRGNRLQADSGKLAIGLILLASAFSFLSSQAVLAENKEGNIENTRVSLEKWIETQRIISAEKRDLVLAKEMLNERIKLVQREIDSLKGKITEAEQNIADADKKRLEMVEENEKLKEAAVSLNSTAASMEVRTKDLIKRLPDPIRDRVKPLSQRLPDNPDQTKLSIAERFQNIVGILNEVNKFNREITITSEVRTLPDGTSAEVTAIYLGISVAYYSGANGKIAGIGTASEEGWVWKPNNEICQQVADLIAILKNEKVASFVQVPVTIQ